MKTLVICSGGMDSVALAYLIKKERELTRLVSFDYGQRHKNELQYAANVSKELQVPHSIIDISNISQYLSGSALTDDIDVPDGHYAEENMKTTVVPNRNAIMLSIAFGVAAGSLGTLSDTDRAASNLTTITATDDEGDTITFSVTAGSLPTGITLNSNGTFSGTADAVSSNTVSSFTVTASDGTNTSTRDYTITVQAPVATGGTVSTYTDSGTNYVVHVFNSNANFVLAVNKTVDYLIVGGGGGGGSSATGDGDGAGGGGAGGYYYATGVSLNAGTFAAVIGSGGGSNNSGGQSSFNSISAGGGGAGGADADGGTSGQSGTVGGSGGGTGNRTNSPGGAGSGGDSSNRNAGGGSGGGGTGRSGANAGSICSQCMRSGLIA